MEIVKRIPNPDESQEKINQDEIIFEEHLLHEEEQQNNNSNVWFILLGLIIMGVIGYFTFNYFKSKETNSTTQELLNVKQTTPINNNESIAITETPKKIEKKSLSVKEKSSTPKTTQYIETLALPTVSAKHQSQEHVIVSKKANNTIVMTHITKATSETKSKPHKTPAKKSIQKHKQTLLYEKIKPTIYRVKKRDSLATIAKKFYGNELEYKRIIRANKRIRSAKTALRLNEKLIIPRKDGKKTRRYIIVEKGDTLALLAKRFYSDRSKIKKIIRANYNIKNAQSLLHLGQKIYIPK